MVIICTEHTLRSFPTKLVVSALVTLISPVYLIVFELILKLIFCCDLLILPTTPDSLAMKAMMLTSQSLPQGTNYHILLTMVPPPPQKDGEDELKVLQEKDFPVIKHGIIWYVFKFIAYQE